MNPAAGRRGGSCLDEITRGLSQPFVELSVHLTTGPGDATVVARQAVQDGMELVVAAGGDGSLNEVANGLVGSDVELGLIPVGTENVLAKELGVPLGVSQACRFLFDKTPRWIDLGRIASRYFVCFAGIGFDAHVAHRLSAARKASLGAMAYFFTSLERLAAYRSEPRRAVIQADDEALESSYWMILIGNIQSYGGRLKPAPRARTDDGLLDLCLYPEAGYPATMRQMVSTFHGKHLQLPGMIYRQAKRIAIATEPVEQVQLDGDPWSGTTPLVVEVEPRSLKVRF